MKNKISDMHPRSPEDFSQVLLSDEPLFIVGGQAVNLWALYYSEKTFDLRPFVSRDMDVLGDRKTLLHIAKQAGKQPRFFSSRPPTNQVGVVVAEGADGEPMPIEVLNSLLGVTNVDLHDPAYTMVIGKTRTHILVPSPIALLQAKIANSIQLPQEGRQDEKHICILVRLMPAYISDLQKSVVSGRINEREMLRLLEKLISVISSKNAASVVSRLNLDAPSMFSELKAETLSKIHLFLTERIPRIFPQKQSVSDLPG